MKIYIKRFGIILALLLIFATPVIADISSALYKGIITVTNNGTAVATNVATTCNISTPTWITSGFANATATNLVLRDSSSSDVPFMPGYGANHWVIWVPYIGGNNYASDILYTNSSGGAIRYFPADGGMTTPDNDSLELGNNGTIEIKGFFDTTAGADKDIVYKQDAIQVFVSPTTSQNITAVLLTANRGWVSPTSFVDGSGNWADEPEAYDEVTTHYAYQLNLTNQWSDFLELTVPALWCDSIRIWTLKSAERTTIDIDYYSGGWVHLYNGTDFNDDNWTVKPIGSTVPVTAMRFSQYINAVAIPALLYEVDFQETAWGASVTAMGVASGNHTVTASNNVTHLAIAIDGVTQNSTLLGGATTNNSTYNWIVGSANTTPYIEYQKIWVNGELRQSIAWNYGLVFDDLSAFNNDATPTFRTTSSNAYVSSSLSEFTPMAEAKAPAYTLGTVSPFITSVSTTGNFTTNITANFPGADVAVETSAAGHTPPQLLYQTLAGFFLIIANFGLGKLFQVTTNKRGWLFGVVILDLVVFGILGMFHVFDPWQTVTFIILSLTIGAFASR